MKFYSCSMNLGELPLLEINNGWWVNVKQKNMMFLIVIVMHLEKF